MSETTNRQIDYLINLLETLPKRMADELEKREEIRKKNKQKLIENEIEFYREHNQHLNKIMFGVDSTSIKIEVDNPNEHL